MPASDYDYRITLEGLSQTVTSGNAQPQWPVQDTTWAKMEGVGGEDLGQTMEGHYRFTLRHRTDVLPRWRIGLSGTNRKFKIMRPPLDETGRRVEIVIYAKEILA